MAFTARDALQLLGASIVIIFGLAKIHDKRESDAAKDSSIPITAKVTDITTDWRLTGAKNQKVSWYSIRLENYSEPITLSGRNAISDKKTVNKLIEELKVGETYNLVIYTSPSGVKHLFNVTGKVETKSESTTQTFNYDGQTNEWQDRTKDRSRSITR